MNLVACRWTDSMSFKFFLTKWSTHCFNMLVIFIWKTSTNQFTVKEVFCWKISFIKSFPGVHVLIRVNSFSHQQFSFIFIWLKCVVDWAWYWFVGWHKFAQRRQYKLCTDNESKLSLWERVILLCIIWYATNASRTHANHDTQLYFGFLCIKS